LDGALVPVNKTGISTKRKKKKKKKTKEILYHKIHPKKTECNTISLQFQEFQQFSYPLDPSYYALHNPV